ncbi:MAG: hypothetical protein ACUVX8_14465 [Candidatus Zipacnadales bacterium]
MTLKELRNRVVSRFGENLLAATPEALAAFLLELQPLLPGTQRGEPLIVNGAAESYEAAMKEYFTQTLWADPEHAAASLWITAVEMWIDAL